MDRGQTESDNGQSEPSRESEAADNRPVERREREDDQIARLDMENRSTIAPPAFSSDRPPVPGTMVHEGSRADPTTATVQIEDPEESPPLNPLELVGFATTTPAAPDEHDPFALIRGSIEICENLANCCNFPDRDSPPPSHPPPPSEASQHLYRHTRDGLAPSSLPHGSNTLPIAPTEATDRVPLLPGVPGQVSSSQPPSHTQRRVPFSVDLRSSQPPPTDSRPQFPPPSQVPPAQPASSMGPRPMPMYRATGDAESWLRELPRLHPVQDDQYQQRPPPPPPVLYGYPVPNPYGSYGGPVAPMGYYGIPTNAMAYGYTHAQQPPPHLPPPPPYRIPTADAHPRVQRQETRLSLPPVPIPRRRQRESDSDDDDDLTDEEDKEKPLPPPIDSEEDDETYVPSPPPPPPQPPPPPAPPIIATEGLGPRLLPQLIRRRPLKSKREIQAEYIKDRDNRQRTFSKRRTGLMKRFYEMHRICGTEGFILVVSDTCHMYTFATNRWQPCVLNLEDSDRFTMAKSRLVRDGNKVKEEWIRKDKTKLERSPSSSSESSEEDDSSSTPPPPPPPPPPPSASSTES